MLKSKVIKLLEESDQLDLNDPQVYNYWDALSIELGKDEVQTITVLKELDENQVLQLSAVFEDIAYLLQSQNYISTLHSLQDKFPNIDIASSIEVAEAFTLTGKV